MREEGQGALAFVLVLLIVAAVLAVLWPVITAALGPLMNGLPLP